MARIRSLKPSFFLDEDLADLPALARLLYAGLWCLADREGRLENRPKRIKAEILPYEACDIDALLRALIDGGWIIPYEVDSRSLIWLPRFKKHQQVNLREPQSELPPPSPDTCTHNKTDGYGEINTCTHVHARGEGKGKEGKGEGGAPGASAHEVADETTGRPDYRWNLQAMWWDFADKLWLAHPAARRGSREDLEWWIRKNRPDLSLIGRILVLHNRDRASAEWHREDGRYIPPIRKWLETEPWMEAPPVAPAPATPAKRLPVFDDVKHYLAQKAMGRMDGFDRSQDASFEEQIRGSPELQALQESFFAQAVARGHRKEAS